MKKIKSDVVDCADNSKVLHLIEIDPVNYAGVYYFRNNKGVDVAYRYKNTISLGVGVNSIDIGANGYQTSFEVLQDGTIANVSNGDALMAQGNKLIFKNVRVEIDPQQYADVYFPSIFHRLFEEQKFENKVLYLFRGLNTTSNYMTPVITMESNFWLIQTAMSKALVIQERLLHEEEVWFFIMLKRLSIQ